MIFRMRVYLIVIAVLQCICLCFILMGVTGGFETNTSQSDHDTGGKRVPNNITTADGDAEIQIPEKVVLVVIDALRLDFLKEENFPFLLGNLRKYQSTTVLKFDVKVDPPTVTLPRVKTLVTGKAPVYMDVLRNFQTADIIKSKVGINQPNLIENLRKEHPDLNICFFGDETWLRLFPTEDEKYSPYFKKWEGVTSFFVKDFYEVDNNVTRHLEDIDDCNFLILHYLGLDHIGHVYGPKQTDLLKRKLNEMDHVIQHLHSHLSHVKSKQAKNLMLVTGDHGMANVGGHGGSSTEEVLTPLVGVVIGGIPHHHSQLETPQINQIDIAPTLAAIWNTAIPRESRGQLILDLVELFKSTDQLAHSYQKNCKHLLNVLGNNRKAASYKLWWSEISKMEMPLAIKKYIELEHELSSTLQNAKNKNTDLLTSYVISMVILICMEIYLFTCLRVPLGKYARFALGIVFIPPFLIYFSSSFIEEEHYIRYYLFPSLLLLCVVGSHKCSRDELATVLKVLMLHRFAIVLNQTGDKWSYLSDLNDFIQERELQWVTATVAVILIYIYSDKTVACSKSFKAGLLTVYVTKLVSYYVEESRRGEVHWLFLDSKLQKLSFIVTFFHFIHCIYNESLKQSISTSTIVILMNLHRCHNLIIAGIVFAQIQLLTSFLKTPLQDTQRLEKSTKSSIRLNSLVTRLTLIWFVHSSFYYQGNSNGLATVDVNAGYVGVESYSSNLLIGTLIFLNTYSSPILAYLFMAGKHHTSFSSDSVVMNGSAHGNHQSSDKNRLRKEKTKKMTEFLPVLLLLSNGAECILYSCTIMIFQNHLFIWSVFVPKLMYLITQSVVCVIASIFYAFVL